MSPVSNSFRCEDSFDANAITMPSLEGQPSKTSLIPCCIINNFLCPGFHPAMKWQSSRNQKKERERGCCWTKRRISDVVARTKSASYVRLLDAPRNRNSLLLSLRPFSQASAAKHNGSLIEPVIAIILPRVWITCAKSNQPPE